MKRAIVVLLLFAMGALGCANDQDATPQNNNDSKSVYECLTNFDCKRLLIVAHRGATYEYPENSLAAVKAAAELGVDFAEVDVRETADDVLVLMHDDTVDRTTNGSGKVSEMTFEQIESLKLNGCIESKPESCRIPTFEEVLSAAKDAGIMIYTDMKTHRYELVAQVISEGDFYETAMVRGYKQETLSIHEIDPKIEIMPSIDTADEIDGILEQVPNLHIVEILSPSANAEFCTEAHEKGIKVQQDVIAFGDLLAFANDLSGWQKFIDSGIDVIQTNMPKELIDAIETGKLTLPSYRQEQE